MIIISFSLMQSGCDKDKEHTIGYLVGSFNAGGAFIEYTDFDGQSIINTVLLPWDKSFTLLDQVTEVRLKMWSTHVNIHGNYMIYDSQVKVEQYCGQIDEVGITLLHRIK